MRNEEGRRQKKTKHRNEICALQHISWEREQTDRERERENGREKERGRKREESGADSENDRQSTMTVHEG